MPRFNDSDLQNYVLGQQAEIEKAVNDTVFNHIVYQNVIPVVTAKNPFTPAVTFVSETLAGQAEFIDGNADDVPMAGSKTVANTVRARTAGIGYGFGWEEVNQAARSGDDLEYTRALAARRAYEEKIDSLALSGDAKEGFSGLKDVQGAKKVTAGFVGKWQSSSATAQAIAADLITLINGTGENSPTADTVVLPKSEYVYAQTTFFGDGGKTALDLIKESYPGMKIVGITALQGAAGSSKHRYLAYHRSPDVVAFHIPMPHQFLQVRQSAALRFEVPGVFRVAGLNIKRKQDFAYADATA